MGDLSTDLVSHENTIERGLTTFVEVGTALAAIRDGKLWMPGGKYTSFEVYCKERWGWTASRGRQICAAAEVAERVQSVTNVTPDNEAQVRPLSKLPQSEQAEAWEEVVEESKAEGAKPTAAKVQEVVTRRMSAEESEEWEPVSDDEIELPVEDTMGAGKASKPKNGREVIPTRDRKEAKRAMNTVTRFICDTAKIGDQAIDPPPRTLRDAINALHGGINPQ